MSRSYKKPVIKLKNNKFYKKQFNKNLRRSKEAYQGMNFKKVNNTWDICDYNGGELTQIEMDSFGEEKYRIIMK